MSSIDEYKFSYLPYAEALYLALKPDPFYDVLERSLVSRDSKQSMLIYYDYSIAEAKEFGSVVTPEKHEDGISVWAKPLTEKESEIRNGHKSEFLRQYLGEPALNFYEHTAAWMGQNSKTIVSENSWYLSIVGLLPQQQGKGLGGELIERVTMKLDDLGASAYLETFTPRNLSFYSRYGFEARQTFMEPLVGAEYIIMVRKPILNQ